MLPTFRTAAVWVMESQLRVTVSCKLHALGVMQVCLTSSNSFSRLPECVPCARAGSAPDLNTNKVFVSQGSKCSGKDRRVNR